jgi:hypothetical protein
MYPESLNPAIAVVSSNFDAIRGAFSTVPTNKHVGFQGLYEARRSPILAKVRTEILQRSGTPRNQLVSIVLIYNSACAGRAPTGSYLQCLRIRSCP